MTRTASASAPTAQKPRRGRGDEGVALVEFAIVIIIFCLFIFGIIAFGVLLSFQQTLTQTANEAARAAAVTTDDPSTTGDERTAAATATVGQYDSWALTCTSPGFGVGGCDNGVVKHDCGALTDTPAGLPDCITVVLAYDYENFPLLPNMPFVDQFLPDTLIADATAQISDVDPNP